MKKQLLSFLSTLALAPAAGFAQDASAFYTGFNNYQIQNNVVDLMNAAKTTSSISENLWGEISKDPKAMCKQVGLGNNSYSNEWNNSNYNKGNQANSSNKQGGGGISIFGIGGANGGGGSVNGSSNAWDKGRSYQGKTTGSNVVVGTDCTSLIESATSMENNRMNNDTQRLGIIVNNETQRYGIDKQHQVAIKQIEAGQVQNVFGGGAKSMMGDLGR